MESITVANVTVSGTVAIPTKYYGKDIYIGLSYFLGLTGVYYAYISVLNVNIV